MLSCAKLIPHRTDTHNELTLIWHKAWTT